MESAQSYSTKFTQVMLFLSSKNPTDQDQSKTNLSKKKLIVYSKLDSFNSLSVPGVAQLSLLPRKEEKCDSVLTTENSTKL